MRTHRTLVCCIALTALAVGSAPAFADCQPFEALVSGNASERIFVDIDKSGAPSSGDKRLVAGDLADLDGNPIGVQYVVGNMVEGEESGRLGATVIDHIFVLNDGVIFAAGAQAPPPGVALHDTSKLAFNAGDVVQRAILGGTGAYSGARAGLAMTRTERGLELDFDLTCA